MITTTNDTNSSNTNSKPKTTIKNTLIQENNNLNEAEKLIIIQSADYINNIEHSVNNKNIITIQNTNINNSINNNNNLISNNNNGLKHVIIQDSNNKNNNLKKDLVKTQLQMQQQQQQQQQQPQQAQQIIAITNSNNDLNSFNAVNSNTLIPLPNLNGDNTLLKALLQTAPKNATTFNNSNSNQSNNGSNASLTAQSTPTEMIVGQISIKTEDSTANNTNNMNNSVATASTDNTTKKPKKSTKNKQANSSASGSTTTANTINKISSSDSNASSTISTIATASNSNTNSNNYLQYTVNNSSSMHIKNLLANSSIQNIINQNLNNQQTVNTNQVSNTNKIARKRKNNSINSTPSTLPTKLTTQQKENNNLIVQQNNTLSTASINAVLLTPNSAAAVAANTANNTDMMNGNELKLIDRLKSVNSLHMSQPSPENQTFSANYPGKHHSNILMRSNLVKGDFFNLKLEQLEDPNSLISSRGDQQMDKKFIEYILKEKCIANKKLNKSESNQNDKMLKQLYKICSARLEKPLPLIEINNHILDSSGRLKELLDENLKPNETANIDIEDQYEENKDMENNICEDYLKKETKMNEDFEYVQTMSPIIDLPKEDDSIKNEDTSIHTNTNINGETKSKITLKLSKKASKNILDTMMKVSDLLQLASCPTSWVLGKLISRETENLNKQISVDQNASKNDHLAQQSTKPNVSSLVPNKETAYSIQQLINASVLKICKFCESLLVDNDFIVNGSLIEDSAEAQTDAGLVFCSEYCESLYEKSLILKNFHKKKQIENTSTSSIDPHPDTASKLVVKWTSSLVKPIRSEVETESNKIKLMETLKPVNCLDKRVCIFCNLVGDYDDNGPSRLLAMDIGKWCHLNCALWSNEVYETMNGSLVNVDVAYKRCVNIECCFCHHRGASLKCFASKCNNYYHLPCAIKDKCAFNQDKVNYG